MSNVHARRIEKQKAAISATKRKKAIDAYVVVMKAIQNMPLRKRLDIAHYIIFKGTKLRRLPIYIWRLLCFGLAEKLFPPSWCDVLFKPVSQAFKDPNHAGQV